MGKARIVVMGVDSDERYTVKNTRQIKIQSEVAGWKEKSKVRFVAVHGEEVYVTDYGLNAVYIINMKLGFEKAYCNPYNNETKVGLRCSHKCKKEPCNRHKMLTLEKHWLLQPSQLLVDNKGNILITGSGNHRLVVLNKEGSFARDISGPANCRHPTGVLRKPCFLVPCSLFEQNILVTYLGDRETDGHLVLFNVH